MIAKKKIWKWAVSFLAVGILAVVLVAWNPQKATAPHEVANTTNATNTPTENTAPPGPGNVPEMVYLSQGQSQPIFGNQLTVTLEKAEQMRCQEFQEETETPAPDPCAQAPVTATLTVTDNTNVNGATSVPLLFSALGAVQTSNGYFYQFIEYKEQKARFIIRALAPTSLPSEAEPTQ